MRPAAILGTLIPVGVATYGLAVLVALLRWAGPPRVETSLFAIGVATLVGVTVALGALGWWLLVKPIRGDVARAEPLLSSAGRRVLTAVLAISGLFIVVGGFWDEAWHRLYGVRFGDDFFWRPHLLMYAGLLAVTGSALGSAIVLAWRGSGGVRARFRRDPTLGWLVLLGAFLAYALPADPAWHALYGADITAWSLPHLVLLVSFSAIMVTAAVVPLASVGARPPHAVWRARPEALLAVLAIGMALLIALQVLAMEWDGLTRIRRGSAHPFWQRPEWLLPVIVVAAATLYGSLAVRLTRAVGAATLVGLVALAVRAALVAGLESPQMTINAWLLALPPLMAIDAWQGVRLLARPASAASAAVASGGATASAAFTTAMAAVGGMAVGTLPLIAVLYRYPAVTAATVPTMLAMGALTASWAAWLGTALGERLRPRASTVSEARPGLGAVVAPVAALALAAIFVIWYVATATKPV
jgi:hypothetical protein